MSLTLTRRLVAGLIAGTALSLTVLPVSAQTAAPTPAPAPATEAADAEPTPGPAPEMLPDIVLGKEDAPLTIVEYASFTCPHCGDFVKETFPKLKAEYIDTGKVRFIQRDVYFDAVGLWASILAHCDPAKYYPVGKMLMTTQDKWLASAKSGDEVAKNLRQIGLTAGMTEPQMEACWNDQKTIEQLVATYQTNATKDGLEVTPTFIIGGEKVPNQSWDALKKKIDEKLAAAGSGTAATPATPATPAAPASEPAPAAPATPAAPAAPATPAAPAAPAN